MIYFRKRNKKKGDAQDIDLICFLFDCALGGFIETSSNVVTLQRKVLMPSYLR